MTSDINEGSMLGQFRKYDHLQRIGHPDVSDICFGTVHIFPKIDGTNASVWCDPEGFIQCGSRNRVLSEDEDNAGFHAWVHGDTDEASAIRYLLDLYPHLVIYGEWLVPHSLKTYRDDTWRKFYVFDVYSHKTGAYLEFDEYDALLTGFGIDVIQLLAVFDTPSDNQLAHLRDTVNTYLIQDGKGVGEGIVLKNYDWCNKRGAQPWAKMVRNEFKEMNGKEFGVGVNAGERMIEKEIIAKFATPAFIRKEFAKVVTAVANDHGVTLYMGTAPPDVDGPTFCHREQFIEQNRGKIIPRFLGQTFLTLVEEEIRTILKKFKNPVIDFSKLSKLLIFECKREMKEVF